ncbi:MAG TPA: HD domain-containing phosphohydrolase [Gemmatimonadaceae bacterium]|nr:HD domain-containing phosphohydrolase [Gemmatimonadaceae bacterium]
MSTGATKAELSPAVATLLERAQQSERSGRRELSRQYYESALYLLRLGDGEHAATIMRRIARTYADDGVYDVALDCFEAALASAEARSDSSGAAHAINGLAVVHLIRGDLDEATSLYTRAKTFVTPAGEPQLDAMITQNLGIIASMRGELEVAIDQFTSCLATYRTAGLRERIGPVLNNIGLVFTRLNRFADAEAAYDEAIEHCAVSGDRPNRLLAMVNSTTLLLARGDVDSATRRCELVHSEATALGDQRALAETAKNQGVIALLSGRLDEAKHFLSAAYDGAVEREDLLLAAETAREQARLYEAMEDSRGVLRALSRSHRLFSKLRAQRDLVDLRHQISRLEQQFFDIVTRWAGSIESKDPYTLGHCERVADYACALALDAGFDEITLFWFRIGALLHDVGKITTPTEILNKPGRLTEEERATMQLHPAVGAEMLRDIEFPWDIIPIVRNHHERWDGAGYPDRLAGDQIPLTARITCIADVFDALTSDRPYRPGFSREKALEMMETDSGKMFDPELLPRFVRLVRQQPVHHGLPSPIRPIAAAPIL